MRRCLVQARHPPGLVLCSTQLVALLLLTAASDVIRIGGLFDRPELRQDAAFLSAVASVNSDGRLLSSSRLSATVETAPAGDSFTAAKRACLILQSGVAALFGPQSCHSSAHVQSMCSAKHVPHILTRWEYSVTSDPYSVNLYPHPSALSKAYCAVLRGLGWTKFTVVYEDVYGLARVQELLKDDLFRITLRQLPEGDDYRPLLKDMKKSGSMHVVLDLHRPKISEVLTQALHIDRLTTYSHYFITSLDLHLIDLEAFRHGGSNITALRLVDPGNSLMKQVLRDLAVGDAAIGIGKDAPLGAPTWSHVLSAAADAAHTTPEGADSAKHGIMDHHTSADQQQHIEDTYYHNVSSWPTEVALLYDAVVLFATAVDGLHSTRLLDVPPLSCEGSSVWADGGAFVRYLKLMQLRGLSGLVRFDDSGFRTDVALDIIELTKRGLTKMGWWTPLDGVHFTRAPSVQRIPAPLSNRSFVATTLLAAPYTMLKADSGSDPTQLEGFCVDLLHDIADELGFSYTLRLAKDGQHGKYDMKRDKWTGMIGELLSQEADMAIGDLTITYEREQAVDFTMPWMNLGISILYRKATPRPPNLFSFLAPLSVDVWLYMATSYIAVSLVLHVLGRLSPCERFGTESQFSLSNSLWFTVGSLLQHGTEQQPRAASTRIAAGIWWFFTLIMISSYTANLAAFLTVERMVSPIESAEDLSSQTRIKYGALYGGSTWNFFSTSRVASYQKMFAFMESQRPSVYSSSNQEGVERVLHGRGQYAFLMESSSIEYVTERYCRLTQVGGLLDAKGYGIALPSGSPYRVLVNDALLRLQESGRLRDLRRKWWTENGGGCEDDDDTTGASTKASALGLGSVGGVFAVLAGGLVLATAVAGAEFFWSAKNIVINGQAVDRDVTRAKFIARDAPELSLSRSQPNITSKYRAASPRYEAPDAPSEAMLSLAPSASVLSNKDVAATSRAGGGPLYDTDVVLQGKPYCNYSRELGVATTYMTRAAAAIRVIQAPDVTVQLRPETRSTNL